MQDIEHTQEPWTMGKPPYHGNEIHGVDRADGSRQLVARVYGYSAEEVRANMRRITACVKACQGIPTGALEAGVVVVPEDDARLIAAVLSQLSYREVVTWREFTETEYQRLKAIASALSRLQQNGGADHD